MLGQVCGVDIVPNVGPSSGQGRQAEQGEDAGESGREPESQVSHQVADKRKDGESDGDSEPSVGEIAQQPGSEGHRGKAEQEVCPDPEGDEAEFHHPNSGQPGINLF